MTPALNTLTDLGIMILFGIFMGRMAKHLKLPNVTGYLLAGVLLGPYFFPALGLPFSILSENFTGNIAVISEVALGFIAFSIGNEFQLSYLKLAGPTPIVIAWLESFFSVAFIAIALILCGQNVSFSLMLGAIAASTAPASTVMVISQYKARGPVSKTLLSVVALDDATGLIMFAVASAAAKILEGGNTNIVLETLSSIGQIAAAFGIGFVMGMIMLIPMKYFKKHGNRLGLITGFIFLGIGIAEKMGLSSLMLCLGMGTAVANLSSEADAISDVADQFTTPIYILFFVASGAELQVSMLLKISLLGVIYIIFRIVGKIFGAWLGGRICKAPDTVCRYLGPCLFPQEGVAIGLMLAAGNVVPKYAAEIQAVVLAGTLIFELIGPTVTKISLTKAGEIKSS